MDEIDDFNDAFDQGELTPEDLAILQAFREMDDLESPGSTPGDLVPPVEPITEQIPIPSFGDANGLDEMLVLFVTEADEDIATMRQALMQLEQDDTLNPVSFTILQRAAHKLKGTAGAIGCASMSTIAYYIEMLVGLIQEGALVPMIGLMALVQAVRALEASLQSITSTGQESSAPLTELEADYEALNEFGSTYRPATEALDPQSEAGATLATESLKTTSPLKEEIAHLYLASRPTQQEVFSPLPSVHVDTRRLEQLVLHTEQLAEERTQLENAHRQIESALQELSTAQSRLQYLEMLFSFHTFGPKNPEDRPVRAQAQHRRSMSSLVARILDEAVQRTGHAPQRKNKAHASAARIPEPSTWDEMEVDRYTENDVLMRAFSEATADITTASAQLRAAFIQFNRILYKHMEQASHVRNDTLLLRSAPLSTLLPRIQRAIKMSADAQQRQVYFEIKGEETEIDQHILEALARPLLQLVRYCVTDSLGAFKDQHKQQAAYHRVWLYAYAIGNEVTIELGFSMTPRSGALDLVRGPIQQLNGSIAAQHNSMGGLSFYLNLPRSQGAMQGLRVRVGRQHVVVPFSQVQRIDYGSQEAEHAALCSLNALLGFPNEYAPGGITRPVLVLQPGDFQQAVEVDEVLGGVELVIKPLAQPLRRPGIEGAALDGLGNVLLIVDLPTLIAHSEVLKRKNQVVQELPGEAERPQEGQTVLVADDSVYIRQSLQQILSRAGYRVRLARDGMEAWEQLLEQPPDALLLDIEMPNLNGYELLSMIHSSSQFTGLRVLMLTARSSEKHQRSAFELGAFAYLIKPCPQETLLKTLRLALARSTPAAGQ